MSIATQPPAPSTIDCPETDGLPIAENTLQFQWIVVIKEGLEVLFRNNPNVFIAGGLFWYPVEGDPTIRVAPDAMVVIGRPKGHRRSYRQWVEGGIAPQVVFEVLSPGNRGSELVRKFHFYEQYGVDEYYMYDPDDGDLAGWRRTENRLKEVSQMDGFVSPRLGIKFEPGDGEDNLLIRYPDGRPFLTYGEMFDRMEANERRADEEKRRADDAVRRVSELEARLRALEGETT
jgi:Uma2 family endonuclease